MTATWLWTWTDGYDRWFGTIPAASESSARDRAIVHLRAYLDEQGVEWPDDGGDLHVQLADGFTVGEGYL